MQGQKHFLQPSLASYGGGALILSALFFLIPMALVASHVAGEERGIIDGVTGVLTSRLVRIVLWNTLEISFCAALIAVALAYPVALHISRQKNRWKVISFALVLMPFWTSILVKSYAFLIILGDSGIVNHFFRGVLGMTGFDMMFNRFAVLVGMTNFLVPYAVFPILASLAAQNPQIQRAAEIMGASRTRTFWRITFIQSLPGALAAMLLCVVISMGFFVTPALLGGRKDMMMANIIDMYTREILDWQSASIISLFLLLIAGGLAAIILKLQSKTGG